VRGTCNIFVERNSAEEECGKPSVYSEPCTCDAIERLQLWLCDPDDEGNSEGIEGTDGEI
jgi:hypothetical protein